MPEGTLYVVATPIGNLQDISRRALDVLARVDWIAAEDTRRSRILLQHHEIRKPLLALHQHNEAVASATVLKQLQAGLSVALISDAGTPLISDPGHRLVSAAHGRGLRVVPIPGPCAIVCALSASGLAAERFVFEGFLPRFPGARKARLHELSGEQRTCVFYESSHRILDTLGDMVELLGAQRPAVLARELTKVYETVRSANLEGLLRWVRDVPEQQRGEFVLVVAGGLSGPSAELSPDERKVLEVLRSELPVKQAVSLAARLTGRSRNLLYAWAMRMRR
jgi:16S rRNA (cytidine1402-2'-O)-methyltransferase